MLITVCSVCLRGYADNCMFGVYADNCMFGVSEMLC